MYKIPLSSTPINTTGLADILRAYEGQSVMKIVEDFETSLRKYTGAKYVLALNSGTAAIHLALKALGVGPGDTVVAPTFTYVATVSPILYLGATPILIDSEPTTWNISPELLETAIKEHLRKKSKPRCVIVVHNYGMPCKMGEIREVCDRHAIPILEDAAEAIGSRYQGSLAGTLGQIGIFSFNNNKIITAYGGGALITENEEIYRKTLFWATQSKEDKPYYEHTDIGFNYRISPLNAAAGLLELKEIDSRVAERRRIFDRYREILANRSGTTWLEEPGGHFSNRWLSTPLFSNPLKINEIMAKMNRNGIECRRLWNPMHLQPYYQKYPAIVNGYAEKLFQEGLCLPSGNLADVSHVASVMNQIS